MEFAPKARINESRANHPDIDPVTGELFADAHLQPDVAARDFNRGWQDAEFRNNFMQRVESFQRALPEEVQQQVQGGGYGSDPYTGVAEYAYAIDQAMDDYRYRQGAQVMITDIAIDRMSLAEYDKYFDERGQPRQGVQVHLMRGKKLDSARPS